MTYPPDQNIEGQVIVTLDKDMEQMELKYVAVRQIKRANHLRELCLLTLYWTQAHTVERKSYFWVFAQENMYIWLQDVFKCA